MPPLPKTISSAAKYMTPCLFSATHWYMPASASVSADMDSDPSSTWILSCEEKEGKWMISAWDAKIVSLVTLNNYSIWMRSVTALIYAVPSCRGLALPCLCLSFTAIMIREQLSCVSFIFDSCHKLSAIGNCFVANPLEELMGTYGSRAINGSFEVYISIFNYHVFRTVLRNLKYTVFT